MLHGAAVLYAHLYSLKCQGEFVLDSQGFMPLAMCLFDLSR